MKFLKKHFKMVGALALAVALVATNTFPIVAEASGSNIYELSVYSDGYDAAVYMLQNGYMNGKGVKNGKVLFDPNANVTRAEFVQVLYNMAGKPFENIPITNTSFADVPATAWYAKAVEWARCANITNGTSATNFAPNATITAEQAAVMINRFVDYSANGSVHCTITDKFNEFYSEQEAFASMRGQPTNYWDLVDGLYAEKIGIKDSFCYRDHSQAYPDCIIYLRNPSSWAEYSVEYMCYFGAMEPFATYLPCDNSTHANQGHVIPYYDPKLTVTRLDMAKMFYGFDTTLTEYKQGIIRYEQLWLEGCQ